METRRMDEQRFELVKALALALVKEGSGILDHPEKFAEKVTAAAGALMGEGRSPRNQSDAHLRVANLWVAMKAWRVMWEWIPGHTPLVRKGLGGTSMEPEQRTIDLIVALDALRESDDFFESLMSLRPGEGDREEALMGEGRGSVVSREQWEKASAALGEVHPMDSWGLDGREIRRVLRVQVGRLQSLLEGPIREDELPMVRMVIEALRSVAHGPGEAPKPTGEQVERINLRRELETVIKAIPFRYLFRVQEGGQEGGQDEALIATLTLSIGAMRDALQERRALKPKEELLLRALELLPRNPRAEMTLPVATVRYFMGELGPGSEHYAIARQAMEAWIRNAEKSE